MKPALLAFPALASRSPLRAVRPHGVAVVATECKFDASDTPTFILRFRAHYGPNQDFEGREESESRSFSPVFLYLFDYSSLTRVLAEGMLLHESLPGFVNNICEGCGVRVLDRHNQRMHSIGHLSDNLWWADAVKRCVI